MSRNMPVQYDLDLSMMIIDNNNDILVILKYYGNGHFLKS